eukprot:TRINITY_DN16463_c0_g1_i1.p1 TRINITY_DN16463_c0_g1~~TRINITY_DN16463_c0_g1_i1.p1  ORF type:complete len:544 (+),score=158.23 TRINITY_DN16463_c0_g1_i1:65-1696(+)
MSNWVTVKPTTKKNDDNVGTDEEEEDEIIEKIKRKSRVENDLSYEQLSVELKAIKLEFYSYKNSTEKRLKNLTEENEKILLKNKKLNALLYEKDLEIFRLEDEIKKLKNRRRSMYQAEINNNEESAENKITKRRSKSPNGFKNKASKYGNNAKTKRKSANAYLQSGETNYKKKTKKSDNKNNMNAKVEMTTDDYWKEISQLTLERSEGCCSELDEENIIIFGGVNTKQQIIHACEIFDIRTNKALMLNSNMITPRSKHSSCKFDNKIYIFGGLDSKHKVTASIEYFDINEMMFIDSNCNMTLPRYNCTTVIHNSLIYIIGGKDNDHQCLNTIEVFDPQTNSILSNSFELLQKRYHCSSTLYHDNIFIFGGIDEEEKPLKSIEVFSIINAESTILDISLFSPRFGHQSILYKDKIIIVGGSDKYTAVSYNEKFYLNNPSQNANLSIDIVISDNNNNNKIENNVSSSKAKTKISAKAQKILGLSNKEQSLVNIISNDKYTICKFPSLITPRTNLSYSIANNSVYIIGGVDVNDIAIRSIENLLLI